MGDGVDAVEDDPPETGWYHRPRAGQRHITHEVLAAQRKKFDLQ
jgi:hypothetical protein